MGHCQRNSSLVLALQGTIEDKHDGEDGDFKSPLLVKTYCPSMICFNIASPAAGRTHAVFRRTRCLVPRVAVDDLTHVVRVA